MQLPLYCDNCICNNYLFCSSKSFFNLCTSACNSLFFSFNSSFCSFRFTISSLILSTINSAVFLSNILNASENILSTSPGLSKYSLISWRTDSRSGNVSTSLSISYGVSATNNDKNFNLSLFIFSETNASLY